MTIATVPTCCRCRQPGSLDTNLKLAGGLIVCRQAAVCAARALARRGK